MLPRIITPRSYSFAANPTTYTSTKIPGLSKPLTVLFASLPARLLPRLAGVPRALPRSSLYSTYHAPRFETLGLTMATATEIHLSPSTDSGIYSLNVSEEAARAASEVLQEDMENHHIFFNEKGFHSM